MTDANAGSVVPSVDTRRLLAETQQLAYVRQPSCCGLDASLRGEGKYCYQTTAIGKHLHKRTTAELFDSEREQCGATASWWCNSGRTELADQKARGREGQGGGAGQPGRCRFCGQSPRLNGQGSVEPTGFCQLT